MKASTSLIKLKILLQIIAVPLLCALILYFALPAHQPVMNLILITALVLGAFLRLILVKRKYIIGFQLAGDQFLIRYLTPYLKTVNITYPLKQVTKTEMHKRNWLSEKPAGVSLMVHKEWHQYFILDKQLYDKVASLLKQNRL